MIKVLVSANSTAELSGLESLVRSAAGLELAGSCLGRAGLAGKVAETHPDVVLESIGRPSAAVQPSSAAPDDRDPESEGVLPAVLWLVPRAEFATALRAVGEGSVQGILPAWASTHEIVAAIEAVAGGLVALHPEIASYVEGRDFSAAENPSAATGQQLSPREGEIMNLLASGLANKEIAWRLKISEHTVKFHITSIFNKLGVSSRAEAVATGIRRGLISL